MRHCASASFWFYYRQLPEDFQQLADKNYDLLKKNPRHPSLYFKKAGKYWATRVGLNYRALATEISNGYLWFWIGDHDSYERIINA